MIAPTPNAGPTKILSYQTAYDALGAQCDPSYTLQGGNAGYSLGASEEQEQAPTCRRPAPRSA